MGLLSMLIPAGSSDVGDTLGPVRARFCPTNSVLTSPTPPRAGTRAGSRSAQDSGGLQVGTRSCLRHNWRVRHDRGVRYNWSIEPKGREGIVQARDIESARST